MSNYDDELPMGPDYDGGSPTDLAHELRNGDLNKGYHAAFCIISAIDNLRQGWGERENPLAGVLWMYTWPEGVAAHAAVVVCRGIWGDLSDAGEALEDVSWTLASVSQGEFAPSTADWLLLKFYDLIGDLDWLVNSWQLTRAIGGAVPTGLPITRSGLAYAVEKAIRGKADRSSSSDKGAYMGGVPSDERWDEVAARLTADTAFHNGWKSLNLAALDELFQRFFSGWACQPFLYALKREFARAAWQMAASGLGDASLDTTATKEDRPPARREQVRAEALTLITLHDDAIQRGEYTLHQLAKDLGFTRTNLYRPVYRPIRDHFQAVAAGSAVYHTRGTKGRDGTLEAFDTDAM